MLCGMMKALALVLLLPSVAFATPAVPEIHQPVVDLAGLLSAQEQEQVASALVGLRDKTGAQMAVLIVDTTSGEPIEDYAIRVARQWRGGQGGANDGLLYVLAVKDHRMRLDVGYGLEESLPDDAVRRLLDAQTPRMRQKDFTGALLAIIEGVSERLPAVSDSASTVPSTPQAPSRPMKMEGDERLLKTLLMLLLLLFLPCAFLLRPRLRQWMGNRVALGLCAALFLVPLRFIFAEAGGRPSSIALALLTLVGSAGLFFLGQHLLVKTRWMQWGCCLMIGNLLGMVFALGAPQPSSILVLFGISTLVFTGILRLAAFMMIGNVLIVPWMIVFGGRAIFRQWRDPTYSSSGPKLPVPPRPSPSSASSSSLVGVYSPASPNTPIKPVAARSASTASEPSLVGVYSPSAASVTEVASSSFPDPSPSSSSWDTSSSSSSSWDSSSSSSSSSDWSGGGGDFGGGGASSSW